MYVCVCIPEYLCDRLVNRIRMKRLRDGYLVKQCSQILRNYQRWWRDAGYLTYHAGGGSSQLQLSSTRPAPSTNNKIFNWTIKCLTVCSAFVVGKWGM